MIRDANDFAYCPAPALPLTMPHYKVGARFRLSHDGAVARSYDLAPFVDEIVSYEIDPHREGYLALIDLAPGRRANLERNLRAIIERFEVEAARILGAYQRALDEDPMIDSCDCERDACLFLEVYLDLSQDRLWPSVVIRLCGLEREQALRMWSSRTGHVGTHLSAMGPYRPSLPAWRAASLEALDRDWNRDMAALVEELNAQAAAAQAA
jgi:hypothetical protein